MNYSLDIRINYIKEEVEIRSESLKIEIDKIKDKIIDKINKIKDKFDRLVYYICNKSYFILIYFVILAR